MLVERQSILVSARIIEISDYVSLKNNDKNLVHNLEYVIVTWFNIQDVEKNVG